MYSLLNMGIFHWFSIAMLVYQRVNVKFPILCMQPIITVNNHQGQLVTAQIGLDCFFFLEIIHRAGTQETLHDTTPKAEFPSMGGWFYAPRISLTFYGARSQSTDFFPMKSETCTLRIFADMLFKWNIFEIFVSVLKCNIFKSSKVIGLWECKIRDHYFDL